MNYDYRLGQLEQMAKVERLEAAQDRGPDPRLWAGDPHDGGR